MNTPETVVDVRTIVPRERHPKIFAAWQALPPGGAILLVNDHEPKPLYYQFQAEHAGEFEWTPVERGPEKWSVRIARVAPSKSKAVVPGMTVKETTERFPSTVAVFVRHGLDLCCGGVHPIAMAAEAHGKPLEPLLEELNAAAAAPQAPKPGKPAWAGQVAVEEDVREALKNGEEPFPKIMAAAQRTPAGGVLLVRAIFEPVPLYAVLGKVGFQEHWSERVGPDDWAVYLKRS